MESYLVQLKNKYNKTDSDIKIAYEIKTIWQSYSGFYNEHCLIEAINNNSISYRINIRSSEDQHLLDNNFAVDIEIINNYNKVIAIQCKQLSYLYLDSNKKEPHLNKHKGYRERFSNPTYYLLFKDNAPCYCITNNIKSYLIASTDISSVSYKNFSTGTYNDFIS